nr:zinc ribbon domain-containing protein [Candidatus Njordarchaeum guaymaensis]
MISRLLLILLSLSTLLCLSVPIYAVADRSLYLTVDKPVCSLGETVNITISIGSESCKQHDHRLDIYIYDSRGLLVFQKAFERWDWQGFYVFGLRPEDFPVTMAWKPPKVDSYQVKLWVVHLIAGGAGHQNAYLEDTAILKVVPYVATTQTTTVSTTAQSLTITETAATTLKSTVSTIITTTYTEMVKVEWVTVLAAVAVALSIAVGVVLLLLSRKKTRLLAETQEEVSLTSVKRCVKCGFQLPADAEYCSECGERQRLGGRTHNP